MANTVRRLYDKLVPLPESDSWLPRAEMPSWTPMHDKASPTSAMAGVHTVHR